MVWVASLTDEHKEDFDALEAAYRAKDEAFNNIDPLTFKTSVKWSEQLPWIKLIFFGPPRSLQKEIGATTGICDKISAGIHRSLNFEVPYLTLKQAQPREKTCV